ncbi:MAG: hypothetical protein Q7S23_02445 [bacterium]|nr:hypothetical protein [bacterium]
MVVKHSPARPDATSGTRPSSSRPPRRRDRRPPRPVAVAAAPQSRIAPVASDTLRIIPLGGQEEVGRNCTVFEYGNDIIVLDMGLQFPEEDMPGIDYIIPNLN